MKQKDIALIVVAVVVSAILSFVLSNILFSAPKDRQQKVEVVDKITSDFPEPDKKYFNSNALDPTQLIQIGNSTNNNPFSQ